LIPILQSIEPAKEFTQYIDAYKRESENLPIPETQKVAEKIYAGSTSCRSCHAAEFTQWKTHQHSRAMKALVDKGMQYNVDCLRCHTVAYKQPGGFTDLRVTPGLSNIQCEVCHGPAQKHVEDKQRLASAGAAAGAADPHKGATGAELKLRMQWDANFCMQCHDPANDPLFNFEQDIKRVHHKDPAPPRDRPTTASLAM
jgi:nitrate/TMAO reductase-like tetraheme cytochrome c subunit